MELCCSYPSMLHALEKDKFYLFNLDQKELITLIDYAYNQAKGNSTFLNLSINDCDQNMKNHNLLIMEYVEKNDRRLNQIHLPIPKTVDGKMAIHYIIAKHIGKSYNVQIADKFDHLAGMLINNDRNILLFETMENSFEYNPHNVCMERLTNMNLETPLKRKIKR